MLGLSVSRIPYNVISRRRTAPLSLHPCVPLAIPLHYSYRLSIASSTRRIREDPALRLVVYEIDVLVHCAQRLAFACAVSTFGHWVSYSGFFTSVTAIVQRSLVSITRTIAPGTHPCITIPLKIHRDALCSRARRSCSKDVQRSTFS